MDSNKLLKMSDMCITDEPSACTAFCPVHVDLRSFMEEIENGDFKKAYKVMSKKIPFPRLIGKICDHPCEEVCVRENIGGSISIGDLEKLTVDLGFVSKRKGFSIPKNDKRVAIVGGGLSGIVAANSLDNKGYNVTIYECTEKIGGRIWTHQGKDLTGESIKIGLNEFKNRNIEINYNTKVDKVQLRNISEQFDAVYLGTGIWDENLEINHETHQIGKSSVFVGGRLFNQNDSVIYSVSSAMSSAISMDRYIQKISITVAREKEETYMTPLVINTDTIEFQGKVERKGDKYTREEAVEEAKRCLKCQCLNCVKICSHLKKYNRVPKKYIREINHNETIVLGNHYANKIINSCTLCGLCKEVCPSCIDMKEIIQETRQSMVERGKMPISAHDFALKDMEFSNSKYFHMVKNQPGYNEVKYVFYPGCQLSASQPEYIEKTYKYLISNIKRGVGIFLGCCGAPADWSGRQDLMKLNVENIRDKWKAMKKPIFILACSSCCSVFEKYMPEIKYISLWEIMDKRGIPIKNKISKKHVLNIHDACTTRHNNRIHNSIRHIVSDLGYTVEELKYSREKTKCCGYGGLVYFANREQSDEFVNDRIQESSEDYLVYCAMCKDLFVSKGKKTYHILDLIYSDNIEKVSLKKAPTLSERHKNRILLKINLLKNIWNEEVDTPNVIYNLNLIISNDVKESMNDRFILLEDVEKVIYNAEKNNEKFINTKNSHYLARLRIGNVTHWVEYEKKDEGLVVHSVYTHRMEIVEE
ncbi:pyridine nucleotide-disulfide oxidoreductase/dicluster-binding protein [Clostridium tyrobutyricum]|uniref:pyridine nucleotide-disulfide oxidoreductase/dicluster-binding protein n=1 Tax=Clostridium tyrobutyricum TaxID=1519 RepID=UPI0039F7106D